MQKNQRYSINSPRGNFGDRVFIGGDYRHGAVIQDIAEATKDISLTPIVVGDFNIPDGDVRVASFILLRQCKYAIFDVTIDGGHIAELERAVDYGTITLCLWDAHFSQEPKISEMVTNNPLYRNNNTGYRTTREMQEKVYEFLR